MCKCIHQKYNDEQQSLPKVLQALIRLERKAENDYIMIKNCLEQIQEMGTILNKLVTTHIDSDNYVDYLFKRAEQLSTHLETYKNIIGKIDIGQEIRQDFQQISIKFLEYLKRKIEFKSTWIESMQTIESGRRMINEKFTKLDDFKRIADDAYNNGKYFELRDLKCKFDEELNNMNDLVDDCFQCGQQSKQLSTLLYDQLTELENNFQRVVRESMNKINEIKRTPAIIKKSRF